MFIRFFSVLKNHILCEEFDFLTIFFLFSEPEYRAFRFGMLHLFAGVARPIAAPIGAQLYKHGGYICVFATSLGGIVLGAIYLMLRIQKYKWTPSKNAVSFISQYQTIFYWNWRPT